MTTFHLSLAQFARALERYDNRYDTFDVFADDVEELYTLGNGEAFGGGSVDGWLDGEGLIFSSDGKRYRLSLIPRSGMARITRVNGTTEQSRQKAPDPRVLGRLSGSAIEHAISVKGEGWRPRYFIGVLTGRSDVPSEERSVTVRYDAPSAEWRAYGGPMSQWLRQAAVS